MFRTKKMAAFNLFAALALALTWGTGIGHASAAPAAPSDVPRGAVYTLSNQTSGNAVLVYDRAADGTLSYNGSYSTGGLGTGAGLGSQGALVLSDNNKWLLAVNAGSNSISSFSVDPVGVTFIDQVASGGTNPISITVHKDLVYVLNAGGAGNISGFQLNGDGTLTPIAGSTRSLSAGAAAPAQVEFSPNGRVIAVTEKGSSSIDTFVVGKGGLASQAVMHASSGNVPFGFSFNQRSQLIVSEAGTGAVSSYEVDNSGNLTLVTASATTHQVAACWVATTKDGRYAYTANGGSGSISGFSVDGEGNLALLTPDGRTAVTGDGSHPLDLAVSQNGRYLYNLTDGLHEISGFAIGSDGSLSSVGIATGLPVGAAGIAAR